MFNNVCDHSRKSLQVCRLITVENIATEVIQSTKKKTDPQ